MTSDSSPAETDATSWSSLQLVVLDTGGSFRTTERATAAAPDSVRLAASHGGDSEQPMVQLSALSAAAVRSPSQSKEEAQEEEDCGGEREEGGTDRGEQQQLLLRHKAHNGTQTLHRDQHTQHTPNGAANGETSHDVSAGADDASGGWVCCGATALQRPVRTCGVLCVAFFFVYTANLAIQNLQSSLHQAAGLGMTSLAVLYGAIIVFGTLSPVVIRYLTAKWTLVLAFVCHLLYTLSNFYPTFPTLLTSSLLLGAVAGPMWTAQGLYCTATGVAYARLTQVSYHVALSLFNGVFFAFYEATQISGNLIASAVLMRGTYNQSSIHQPGKTCGAGVCPGVEGNGTSIEQPETSVVYVLLSVYLACNVLGLALTALLLPPLPRDQEIQERESSLTKSAASCLSMLLVPKMLLLLPFFMAQAMNSGILLAEYNEKFVSCTVGIQWVGYVMATFGGLTAAQAVGLNYAARYLPRPLLFTTAALADLSVNVAMLLWDPTGSGLPRLFILPCVSGFAEGIFQAQFNSLVAMVFPNHVTGAFATYHTSKATAFTLTFVLARFLCLYQRLYVSVGLSTLGLLGYWVVEVVLRRAKGTSCDLSQGNATHWSNEVVCEEKVPGQGPEVTGGIGVYRKS